MIITEALPADHRKLTELTIASKSHWNYSKEQIERWIPDLTITSEYIKKNKVFKLIQEERIIAYYSYCALKHNEILLDNLFVAPDYIGTGAGSVLMKDVFARAKADGVASILTYSDPNSEGFYLRFEFEVVGKESTSIKNRFLPILRKMLR